MTFFSALIVQLSLEVYLKLEIFDQFDTINMTTLGPETPMNMPIDRTTCDEKPVELCSIRVDGYSLQKVNTTKKSNFLTKT